MTRTVAIGLILLLEFSVNATAGDDSGFFERKVRPLLVQQCGDCHGVDEPEGGVTLTSISGIAEGGSRGVLLVPGKLKQSRLIQAVRYTTKLKMPPEKKLSQQEISILEEWVRTGAKMPGDAVPTRSGEFQFTDEDRRWWSFQPIRNFVPPDVNSEHRVRTPVDRFVLRKLEQNGLTLSPDADRRTFIRRVSFDLIGLPPTPEEVESFVADQRPDAFERLVDRLLASSHYGERWGRHWLDLARYADTNGGGFDYVYPNAWRYRDYVVDAFNADKQYDTFLVEQLAGDLLTPSDDGITHTQRLAATGLLMLAPKGLGMQDKEQMILDVVDDQIDVLGRSLIGLTLSCARCHDHKFDPIPTEDYYALAGIFRSTTSLTNTDKNPSYWPERPLELPAVTTARKKYQSRQAANKKAITAAKKKANAAVMAEARKRQADYIAAAARIRATIERQTAIAHWAFDAADGSEVNSSIGPNGELANAGSPAGPRPTRIEGRTGGALQFDGQKDIVAVKPKGIDFGAATDFTVSLWLRARRGYSPQTADSVLAANYPSAMWFIALRPGSYNGIYLRHYDGKRTVDIKPSKNQLSLLTDNAWHHVVFASDRNGKGTVYVDGKVVGEVPIASVSQAAQFHSCKKFSIGAVTNQFRGELDDVAIWNRLLSVAEIQRLFTQSQDVATIEAARKTDSENRPADTFSYEDAAAQGLTPSILRRFVDLTANADGDALQKLIKGAKTTPYVVGSDAEAFYSESVKQQLTKLDTEARAIEQTRVPDPVMAMIAADAKQAIDLRVHIAGDPKNLGDVAPRGFPKIVGQGAGLPANATATDNTQSGRLELARWLTSPDHPLTARVFVNHIWKWHFGEGLVRTPDNFGRLGERPSHPELLDWLALRFIQNGWSPKDLHRQIVLSTTYRQSSRMRAVDANSLDPHAFDSANRWLWRMNRRRLEGEALRDAMLAASGQLDRRIGGAVNKWKAKMFSVDDANNEVANYNTRRRSIYLPVVRGAALHEMLQLFDFGDPNSITARRGVTTVAPQALFLMNNPFVIGQAKGLANRLASRQDLDVAGRIQLGYQFTLSRSPTSAELERAANFLDRGRPEDWQAFCQMLLCLNEFAHAE